MGAKQLDISGIMPRNELKEEEKITARDIYERLWKCRDFEITHLWQRSIFLTTFLVLCFTGYGAIVLRLCESACRSADGVHQNDFPILTLHVAGILVALLGLILSVLWVMMAKGSKAWYEMYERAIHSIESDPRYAQTIVVEKMRWDHLRNDKLAPPSKVDNCLLSTMAGTFSPSKINIVIGQIAMLIWILIFALHILALIVPFGDFLHSYPCAIPIISIALICLLWHLGLPALYDNCKSSYNSNTEKKQG